MKPLITAPNFTSPDAFYETLIEAHRDLELAQSHELNAALVLLLCNHIGDLAILQQAFEQARQVALDQGEAAAPTAILKS